MNRIETIIVQASSQGEINPYFANKLEQTFEGQNLTDSFTKCFDLAKGFTQLGVSSDSDYRHAMAISQILEKAYVKIDLNLLSQAYQDRNSMKLDNINDYYFLVLKTAMQNKELKKNAYPSMMGALSDDYPEQYNMEKWTNLVHKIYDAVFASQMSYENAIDYYAGTLDHKTGEDLKFKKWLKYYKDGENQKYSQEEIKTMKKDAFYQMSPSGIDFYQENLKPIEDEIDDAIEDAHNQAARKKDYEAWKGKLHGAIRRIDKLLRNEDFIEPVRYEELMNLLHTLDVNLGKVRLQATASDLAFQAANKLHKMGYSNYSDELRKVAQEAPPAIPVPPEEEPMATPAPKAAPAPAPAVPAEEVEPPEPKPVPLSSIKTPGPARGEYEILAGDVTIKDAASKLEEVAARLADRRSIRMLAEFDIMLDKLGVATMFPELSEAQTKLMDAYSYALTRVTRMLGMLAGGQALLQGPRTESGTVAGEVPGEEGALPGEEGIPAAGPIKPLKAPAEAPTPIEQEFEAPRR